MNDGWKRLLNDGRLSTELLPEKCGEKEEFGAKGRMWEKISVYRFLVFDSVAFHPSVSLDRRRLSVGREWIEMKLLLYLEWDL